MPILYMVISELLQKTMETHPEVKEKLWCEVLRAKAAYQNLVKYVPIPGVRARTFQGWTDKLIEQEIVSRIGKRIRCKAGCSYCCHLPVSVTKDEAHLLSKSLERYPIKDNGECRFLKENLCEVYEIRPASCRKHFSLDPNEHCKREEEAKGVHKLVIIPAEIIWSGAIQVVGSMLLKDL